jgi:hypothetical protein
VPRPWRGSLVTDLVARLLGTLIRLSASAALLSEMSAPNKCPGCGENVSMFAAGCAICGVALDPFRGQQRALPERVRSAWGSRLRLTPRLRVRVKRK